MGLFETLLNRFRVDPIIQKAAEKEWLGDFEGAIKDLEDEIAATTPTPDRLKALALLLLKCDRCDEAQAYSGKALALAPGQPEMIVTHARVLRRMGNFDDALPLIADQYDKDKKNVFVAMEFCKLLVDMGDTDDAYVIFDETDRWFKAVAHTPKAIKNGTAHAYREAKAKMKHGGRRARKE